MTKEELNKNYRLSLEIQELEERIKLMEEISIGSPTLSDMPKSQSISNPIEDNIIAKDNLKRKLNKLQQRKLKEEKKVEKFISTIPDPNVRTIFRRRYIYFQSWDLIIEESPYSDRHVYRLHNKYLSRKHEEKRC